MKTVNVAELEGVALDWAVAIATQKDAGIARLIANGVERPYIDVGRMAFSPSICWTQAGPLIEMMEHGLIRESDGGWSGVKDMAYAEAIEGYPWGPTPLIAACRAIVAAKFGDTVEVPEELL